MFLNEYENEINKICNKENIYCLNNFDRVKFGIDNALVYLSKMSNTRDALNSDGKFDMLTNDLIDSISPAIKFSIANLYLYLKYANNFVNETININGRRVSTYFKTVGEVRYFYYLNASFEKLYNYWDRIGDILEFSFNLKIHQRKIYFGKVIDRLDKLDIKTKDFFFLKSYRNSYYEDYLNRIRKIIVHDRQKETYFFQEWLGSISDENHQEKMKKLQIEKESYPKDLNEQLTIANKGFEAMVNLIAEKGFYER